MQVVAALRRQTSALQLKSIGSVQSFGSFSKKGKKSKDKKENVSSQMRETILKGIRGERKERPSPFSEEEKQRHFELARTYNRMTSIRDNHLKRDIQLKIDLKNVAIAALPQELQAEAREEDGELFPYERVVPTWTPPIPGYKPVEED